jgi:putative acetyltransferase
MPTLTVEIEDPGSSEARSLIAQLDEFLQALYPPECNHLLSVEELRKPNATFLVARVDRKAAGCGAFVNHGGEYAELKRMFVLPEFRGMKIGRRILEALESMIGERGLKIVRLETGVKQLDAHHLYQRFGYERRSPFGSYWDDPLSIFMEKTLMSATDDAAIRSASESTSGSGATGR